MFVISLKKEGYLLFAKTVQLFNSWQARGKVTNQGIINEDFYSSLVNHKQFI